MEIPFNHDYTLSRAWKVAKTYFVKTNTSSMGTIEERSNDLRKICEVFYPGHEEMLDEDDLPEGQEDGPVEPLFDTGENGNISVSRIHFGLDPQQTASLHECPAHDKPTASHVLKETTWPSEQTKLCDFKGLLVTSATTLFVRHNALSISNIDSTLQVSEKGAELHSCENLQRDEPAVDDSSFDAIIEQKPVMAYFDHYSPEDEDVHDSELPASPSPTVSSDEIRVNSPDQSQFPEVLGVTLGKYDDTNDPFLKELGPKKHDGEGEDQVLKQCCTLVKDEWEGLMKIIEGNHETEIADIGDEFDFEKKSLTIERDETLSLSRSLESEKTKMEQDHKETLRKLREKGKETKEEVENNQALTVQILRNEFAAEKEDLMKGHAASLRELNTQHHHDTIELRRALQARGEDLTRKADSLEEWKSRAEMLQAQHDDRCQTGSNCVQQVQDLKNQVGTQQKILRENWPLMEQEVQEANTQTAVAQKDLEDFRKEAEKAATEAHQQNTQLELKMTIVSQKFEQAKKLLIADDTKAASLGIMEASAEELGKLMEENHEKVAEIHDLYQKRNTIMRTFQEQIDIVFTYLGELEVERNDYQASSAYFETGFMTLRDRFLDLEQTNTQLRLMNNDLEIRNNDLKISNLLRRRN